MSQRKTIDYETEVSKAHPEIEPARPLVKFSSCSWACKVFAGNSLNLSHIVPINPCQEESFGGSAEKTNPDLASFFPYLYQGPWPSTLLEYILSDFTFPYLEMWGCMLITTS